jgi:predicted O-methyltransferase YrrM
MFSSSHRIIYRIEAKMIDGIPGWMKQNELNWLTDAARKSKCIAEVGAWRGRTTFALAQATPGKVFSIDTWDDSAVGIPGWWTTLDSPEKYQQKNWLFHEFKKNLSQYIDKNVFAYRMDSVEAAHFFEKNERKFDMIFIDAGHTYDQARNDIQAWLPLLVEGGIFCGHDYDDMNPGVMQAVNSFNRQFTLVDSIWQFC